MKQGILLLVLGAAALLASLLMYQVGSTSTHLSELKDYYYMFIPLGLFAIVMGIIKLSRKQ